MRGFYINEKTRGFSNLYKAAKSKSRGEKLVVYFDGSELDYNIVPAGGIIYRPLENWVILDKIENCIDKHYIFLKLNSAIIEKKTEIEQKNNLTLTHVATPKCIPDYLLEV